MISPVVRFCNRLLHGIYGIVPGSNRTIQGKQLRFTGGMG